MSQHVIGVISDTHGLLRPEAAAALKGVELIIHAGDIGAPEILAVLKRLAPLWAVRGNTDRGGWANKLPLTQVVEVGEARLYVLHELFTLDIDPAAAGMSAVIFGHSHEPTVRNQNGVLYLNPGSAGPRRWTLPVTMARLLVRPGSLSPEIIHLLR
jgi:putative phosphoesterase